VRAEVASTSHTRASRPPSPFARRRFVAIVHAGIADDSVPALPAFVKLYGDGKRKGGNAKARAAAKVRHGRETSIAPPPPGGRSRMPWPLQAARVATAEAEEAAAMLKAAAAALGGKGGGGGGKGKGGGGGGAMSLADMLKASAARRESGFDSLLASLEAKYGDAGGSEDDDEDDDEDEGDEDEGRGAAGRRKRGPAKKAAARRPSGSRTKAAKAKRAGGREEGGEGGDASEVDDGGVGRKRGRGKMAAATASNATREGDAAPAAKRQAPRK